MGFLVAVFFGGGSPFQEKLPGYRDHDHRDKEDPDEGEEAVDGHESLSGLRRYGMGWHVRSVGVIGDGQTEG